MTQCPDCKSTSVQSKGYRTKGIKRYLCNNCGRNFTVDQRPKTELSELPQKIQEEVMKIEIEGKAATIEQTERLQEVEKAEMTTISIRKDVKVFLDSIKLIPQEPYGSVLNRLKLLWEKGKIG